MVWLAKIQQLIETAKCEQTGYGSIVFQNQEKSATNKFFVFENMVD